MVEPGVPFELVNTPSGTEQEAGSIKRFDSPSPLLKLCNRAPMLVPFGIAVAETVLVMDEFRWWLPYTVFVKLPTLPV